MGYVTRVSGKAGDDSTTKLFKSGFKVSNGLKTTKRLASLIWTNLAFHHKALLEIDFAENIGNQRGDKTKTF